MSQETPELYSAWSFPIIGRGKEYRLTAKLYKSKLVIEDRRGNKISINKRSRAIIIKRWGNVDWVEEIPNPK
jgi:hypothetical protein